MAVDGASDRAAVLEGIRTLATTSAPPIEDVERTLTDGYAHVLEIETERLRLQRLLEKRAAALTRRTEADVGEVSRLARGVARADAELAELRQALADLAALAQRLRV
jgi:hypothetical protein